MAARRKAAPSTGEMRTAGFRLRLWRATWFPFTDDSWHPMTRSRRMASISKQQVGRFTSPRSGRVTLDPIRTPTDHASQRTSGGVNLPMNATTLLSRFRRMRGAAVPHHKETADFETTVMPLPREIVLPMQQHIGALCEPVVKKGDHVDVGTLVGHAPRGLSADIFSGVSGTVKAIQPVFYSTGKTDTTVVIEADGAQTVSPDIAPPNVIDRDTLLEAMKKSGIVGLGGAGFPTDVKLAPPNLDEIDTWLVNATECEPYLSTDFREMMEHADSLLHGIRTCLKLLGVPQAIICIEDDKPQAIDYMRARTSADDNIEVRALPGMYPQGAENVLVYNVTGRVVPRGKRQTDVGVMLFNVTTMSMIGHFLRTGMPLIKRRVTVTGDAVARPQNVEVVIGTRIRDIVDYCGLAKEPHKIIVGGPMMGNAQIDLDYPLVRQNGGLLVFSEEAMEQPVTTACIRCGRCTNSCPMQLSPIAIKKAYTTQDANKLDKLMADLCMGCGTCSYVCPAKQPLAQTSKLARDFMRAEMARRG